MSMLVNVVGTLQARRTEFDSDVEKSLKTA